MIAGVAATPILWFILTALYFTQVYRCLRAAGFWKQHFQVELPHQVMPWQTLKALFIATVLFYECYVSKGLVS